MPYQHALVREDYSQFASGAVIRSAPGFTSFPVRLSFEIFARASEFLRRRTKKQRFTVYDPLCGGGHLITTIGIRFGDEIGKILASDISEDAVNLARKNLRLLQPTGMEERIAELENLQARYGRASHAQAIHHARHLMEFICGGTDALAFQADAFSLRRQESPLQGDIPDLVVGDVPYGNQTVWISAKETPSPGTFNVERFLDSVASVVASHGVVAVVTPKTQKPLPTVIPRIGQFSVGKRLVSIFSPSREM